MTEILGIDLETASAIDIKDVGAWCYSLHESTIVHVAVFGFAAGKGRYRFVRWHPGEPFPADVRDWIAAGGDVLAHNESFEIAIWDNVLSKHDVPPIAFEQWHDTQPLGRAVNLPASLDGLAHALGCPIKKDLEGAKVMKAMATLDLVDGEWVCGASTPENHERLDAYCETDVGAMLDCWYRLPKLSTTEAAVYRVDREVNRRGVFLDLQFAANCARVAEARKAELDGEVFSVTAGELANSRAAPALKAWLWDRWVPVPTIARRKKLDDGTFRTILAETCDKNAVNQILENPSVIDEVRDVLLNRMESNKVASLSKLRRVPLMTDAQCRLRNALAFQGAHTGRWTSYGLQVHNLAKDRMGPGEGSLVRLALRRGDLDLLEFAQEQPLDSISQSIRSCVSAPAGRELIAADYSAVEARVVAWLAGQDDILRLFHAGTDVYVYAANNAGSDNRQLGKVMVLMLGFGAGALKFLDTAAKWGVYIEPKEARRLHKAWRANNPAIVQFWADLETACRDAISHPGEKFPCGLLTCVSTKACLFIRLPSGRALRYWRPKVVSGGTKKIKTLDDEGQIVEIEMPVDEIRYFRPKGAAMVPQVAYGGLLTENATQAVARDLLAEATIRVDAVEPYDIVMHVHDSLAAEVPEGEGDVDEFCELMNHLPSWAEGLPLETEGYRDTRFRG